LEVRFRIGHGHPRLAASPRFCRFFPVIYCPPPVTRLPAHASHPSLTIRKRAASAFHRFSATNAVTRPAVNRFGLARTSASQPSGRITRRGSFSPQALTRPLRSVTQTGEGRTWSHLRGNPPMPRLGRWETAKLVPQMNTGTIGASARALLLLALAAAAPAQDRLEWKLEPGALRARPRPPPPRLKTVRRPTSRPRGGVDGFVRRSLK